MDRLQAGHLLLQGSDFTLQGLMLPFQCLANACGAGSGIRRWMCGCKSHGHLSADLRDGMPAALLWLPDLHLWDRQEYWRHCQACTPQQPVSWDSYRAEAIWKLWSARPAWQPGTGHAQDKLMGSKGAGSSSSMDGRHGRGLCWTEGRCTVFEVRLMWWYIIKSCCHS